ncbi:exodeoxyribonuclease III [Aureococcus anophagefferens]|nr:exodeoxyribonuclease III [Aureococcus anophagefferens]
MSCFSARLDSAALVTSLIECLIEEKRSEVVAHIAIDAAGLELHVVGRSKSTHATLTLPVSCFAAFDCVDETGAPFVRGGDQEPIAFSVDVRALVECLKLFGAAGADLEDSNDLEGATDMAGAFRDAPTAAKTLATSATLRDVVADFDESAVGSSTNKVSVHFRLAASGSVGCVQIDVPRDAFVVFEAPEETRSWTYQTQAFLHGMKALPHSHETYVRVNDHGMLLVQHMVANDRGAGDNMYLDAAAPTRTTTPSSAPRASGQRAVQAAATFATMASPAF